MSFGSRYPPGLNDVIRHAQRLKDYLARKERTTYPFDPASPWLTGRSGEVQCVVALIALDWHEGRVTTEAAVAKLGRYVRDLHDGLAMHLDIEMPPCCRAMPAEALPGPPRRAPARPTRTASTVTAALRGPSPAP